MLVVSKQHQLLGRNRQSINYINVSFSPSLFPYSESSFMLFWGYSRVFDKYFLANLPETMEKISLIFKLKVSE